jgi:hypothetical protein
MSNNEYKIRIKRMANVAKELRKANTELNHVINMTPLERELYYESKSREKLIKRRIEKLDEINHPVKYFFKKLFK